MIVGLLMPASAPVRLVIDNTVLRRSGHGVFGAAWHHDPLGGPPRGRLANAWVVQHRPDRHCPPGGAGQSPLLIVGMVALIRRLSMVSAKADNLLDTPRFRALLLGSPSWRAPRCCSG